MEERGRGGELPGGAGEAELAALQASPGDRHKAVALAEVLLARAEGDLGFGQALRGGGSSRPS